MALLSEFGLRKCKTLSHESNRRLGEGSVAALDSRRSVRPNRAVSGLVRKGSFCLKANTAQSSGRAIGAGNVGNELTASILAQLNFLVAGVARLQVKLVKPKSGDSCYKSLPAIQEAAKH